MFEQHLFEPETAPQKAEEGDLFYNYERKNWEFTPRLYKIIAASAAINILMLVVFAQTNVLTMRGCESPFVGRVCQVLDMAYVGTVLFGTERDFVDMEYDKIDLGEADITWVDRTGDLGPFQYPEGYFQIANPEQSVMTDDLSSSFSTQQPPENNLFNSVPELPKPNPNAVTGDEPTSPFAVADTPTKGRKGRKSGRPDVNANTDDGETVDDIADANTNANTDPKAKDPKETVATVDINKRPMVDLGNFVNDLREKKEVDLESQFMVNAKGKLDKNGRLDPKTFKYVQASSQDEKMLEVVKESIEAINVAGYLQYLKELSGKDFNLVLQQDTENITAVVQSELESDTRARTIKSALDLAISIAKSRKTAADADQNDKDDLVLLEGAKIETNGKNVIIKFTVPKAIAHPMIQRKLAEQAADAKKPSGNAMASPNDNTAAR
jgi:hypothetical protein